MTSSPSERGIRFPTLVSEAWRIAIASPVSTTVLVLITAGVTAFILSTTGQTVRAEQQVLARIDQAGTRLVSVFDSDGTADIPVDAVELVGRLSSVEWVIGLGYATDGRNTALGQGGAPVAVREVWGELPTEVVVNGRAPGPGEGLIGVDAQTTAGLELPLGSLDVGDHQVALVGGFTAGDALGFLQSGVLVRPTDATGARLRSIHVLATTPAQVEPLTRAVLGVVGAEDPLKLALETSQTLADVRIAVSGQLGAYGRDLVLAALAASLVLVALVVYGSVSLRRQDFGRRRALGAGRPTIISLVATQSLTVAAIGALVGAVVGTAIVWRLTGGPPTTIRFTLAIIALTILAALAASIPTALIAAYRDPVRVLRVP